MTDIIINDHLLNEYAKSCAEDIIREIKEHGGDAQDMAHEHADGSEWVIYYARAHALCQNCDTSEGEAFISDCYEPMHSWTYDSIACAIAFGELHARILWALEHLADQEEAA
jgi:hypothetical protein